MLHQGTNEQNDDYGVDADESKGHIMLGTMLLCMFSLMLLSIFYICNDLILNTIGIIRHAISSFMLFNGL
jgi:hypothetical protein